MTRYDPRLLETAFVIEGTPTLADCLAQITAAADLSPTRRRDLASGLRRLASAIGRPLEQVPADPTWLRPRVAAVAPAAIGLKPKTWSNTLSDAHAALSHCGIVERRFGHITGLDANWRPLWDAVIATGDQSLAPALGRFVRFLNKLGIAPEKVSDADAEAYQQALEMNELRRSPEEARRHAVYGWNLATERIAAWPAQRLTQASRSRRYALPLEAFPQGFQDDVARCLARMAAPDPLDPDGLTAALRPETIRHRRAQMLRLASAIVHSGTPVAAIDGLARIAEPDLAKQGLRWMMARHGGKTTPAIADTAIMLKAVGRYYLKLPGPQLAEIAEIGRRLFVPPKPGLTAKNRERLRQFDDSDTVRRLLRLPDRLMERAETAGSSYRALLDSEIAVALAIVMICPIRRRNLARLHLERNLRRFGDGRAFLVFEPGEVKNGRMIEFELPARIVALIDRHVACRSPLLCPAGTVWLFPRRDGSGPMEPSSLSSKVSAIVRKDVGAEMNLHLFRHLAAKFWLDRHPGNYEALRRLLGHAELSSTLNAYAGFEAGTALRLFSALIEDRRTGP